MAYIKVGTENSTDVELYYEDHGSGQPVVLIHGYPLDGSSWEKQTTALLDAGYRVITYDRRGFGTVQQAHRRLRLRHLRGGPQHPADHPGPATTPSWWASRWAPARWAGTSATYGSARVAKAAFLGSLEPYLLQAEDNPERRPAVGVRRADGGRDGGPVRLLHGILQELLQQRRPSSAPPGSARRSCGPAGTSPPRGGATASAAAQPTWLTDFRADIPKIDVPALIVHGTADNILPIDVTGRQFAKALPSAEYVEIDGAPHGLLWTHAAEVNEVLLRFLSK